VSVLVSAPPILESGDRLTRAEFHRRYCQRQDIRKAELVLGVVYVGGRVPAWHGSAHASAVAWLGISQVGRSDAHVENNVTVILDDETEVQPDACLWREEPAGPRLNEDHYLVGPPQLVVEVAASSASYELHDKKEAYRRAGVREYVAWRVLDRASDWFRLQDERYVPVEPDARGVVESVACPGLRLAVASMLADDLAAVLAELEWGRPG
jgi:Uma2 family endonuclease